MNAETNAQTVQAIYDAFKRGDIPTLLSMLTDDVEWFVGGPASVIPYAGARRGREQVKQFFQTLGETLEFKEFNLQELIAQGDKVVAIGNDRRMVKATNRIAENRWAMVWTLRDGKGSSFYPYEDTAAIVDAFTAAKSASSAMTAKS